MDPSVGLLHLKPDSDPEDDEQAREYPRQGTLQDIRRGQSKLNSCMVSRGVLNMGEADSRTIRYFSLEIAVVRS